MKTTFAALILALGFALPAGPAEARDAGPPHHGAAAFHRREGGTHLHGMQRLQRRYDHRRIHSGRPRRVMRSM